MTELSQIFKFGFGRHIERAILEVRSSSGARTSDACKTEGPGENSGTGSHQPTSYTMGTRVLCETHHAGVSGAVFGGHLLEIETAGPFRDADSLIGERIQKRV